MRSDRWLTVSAVLMLTSLLTLMRAYLAVKLVFVALFLIMSVMGVLLGSLRITVHPRLLWFYFCTALAGTMWAFIGAIHSTNHLQGVLDGFRLYVIWSAAFFVLYTLLRARLLKTIHSALILSGFLVPLINLVALYDVLNDLGLIPASVLDELNIGIGFGHDYPQFDSNNVISMFVIMPYLLALQFRSDARKSWTARLALLLSLAFVVVSGRRALWLVVALTPCMVLVLSKLSDDYGLLKKWGRRCALAGTLAGVVGFGTLFILPSIGEDTTIATRLREAFSEEDYRTIQAPFLIDSFLKSPVFGSGFGAYGGITRSEEQPWTYELTYHQILFNLGAVGVTFIGTLFSVYFVWVIRVLKQFKSATAFALLVAFCSLLIGAWSNPYLGGFDSLFFVGLLPYLSTLDSRLLGLACHSRPS